MKYTMDLRGEDLATYSDVTRAIDLHLAHQPNWDEIAIKPTQHDHLLRELEQAVWNSRDGNVVRKASKLTELAGYPVVIWEE